MASRIKSAFKYLAMIAVTALLLWLSLRGLKVEGESKVDFLWEAWKKSDKIYLWLMAIVAVFSHILRALRWKMLLHPLGYHVGLFNSFISLMTGYLVNLAVPRGGEVSRCYNLYQLEKTPVEVSFGTVITERLADVICLLILVFVSFFLEWKKLKVFIDTLNFSSIETSNAYTWIGFGLLGLMLVAVVIYFLRKHEKLNNIFHGFKDGLLSVFRLENKWLFIVYSIGIWVLYFVMSYFVIKAFPETSALGFSAVVTLFAIGSIAMAAPLPGGTGSYHVLVPLGLTMLYNLPKADAVAFVFIFHAWQTLLMIVLGLISFVISYWIIARKKKVMR